MTLLSHPSAVPAEIEYPESDGRPLAETEVHLQALFDLRDMLVRHFASDPAVYIGSNLLLYYQEGDPRKSVAPDLFVARGVPRGVRRTYRLWVEGVMPQWVLEATSRKTRLEDARTKKRLYARLGVLEYVLYDPLAEYLTPPLQAFRLVDGQYEPIPSERGTRLASEVLGLELYLEGLSLRLFDPVQGRDLETSAEGEARERQRAEAEAAARRAAEARAEAEAAENARLRAEIERLRGDRG